MRRAVHAKAANAFAGIGSTAVFQLRAFMADRVGRPSWSAGSVSRSVNPARSCLHRLTAKAAGHVTLRNGVPSMTKDEKEKTHVDAIIERYKDLMVEIPPADRQPGLSLLWPVPAQPAIDKASARPRTGLPTRSKASSGPPSPSAATACPHRCRRPPSKWPS